VIILAAGFGTRLQKDLDSDQSGLFNHLLHLPKPLLPLNNKPLLSYWLEQINQCQERILGTYIVTNEKYNEQFKKWAILNNFPISNIYCDGTQTNETRVGALTDLLMTIRYFKLEQHNLLIIAGDTLFLPSFSLNDFIKRFFNFIDEGAKGLICYYEISNHNEVSKRGIIEINENGQVMNFLEKPNPNETTSNLAVPPLYIYSPEIVSHLTHFVEKHTKSREERDAPGLLLPYLNSLKVKIFSFKIEGRFDVGGLSDYTSCDTFFRHLKK